jgi:WD40 repeat protein
MIMASANPDRLKQSKLHSARGVVFCLARSHGSSTVYLGDSEFKVSAADPTGAKWEPKEIGKHTSYVTGVALAGKQLVSGAYDGQLIWWDVEKSSQVRAVDAHRKWIRRVVVSPDGNTLASVADDMVARLWEAGTGKLVRELKGHQEKTPTHFPSMLFTCTFSPDGKHLATADKVGHIVVWEVNTGKQVATMEAPGMYTWDPRQRIHSIGGIRSSAFSPDGKSLAVGGIGQIGNIDHLDGAARVEVFDWTRCKRTHEFAKTKFKGLVERLVFHPQGDWLLATGGANDGFFFFADLEDNKVVKEEKIAFHVHDVALNETGDSFVAAGFGKVGVWEMKD